MFHTTKYGSQDLLGMSTKVNAQYNSIRGDQWNEQMAVKEKRERARGVLLYLEEMYEQVKEKITKFDSFFEEIKVPDSQNAWGQSSVI